MIYDRGNLKQVLSPHQDVAEKEYTGARVKLPAPSEIPNVDLQVVNYHDPPVVRTNPCHLFSPSH